MADSYSNNALRDQLDANSDPKARLMWINLLLSSPGIGEQLTAENLNLLESTVLRVQLSALAKAPENSSRREIAGPDLSTRPQVLPPDPLDPNYFVSLKSDILAKIHGHKNYEEGPHRTATLPVTQMASDRYFDGPGQSLMGVIHALDTSPSGLRALSPQLNISDTLFPTQSAARTKKTRYKKTLPATDATQSEVDITFDINAKNLNPIGGPDAIWKETGEATLYWSAEYGTNAPPIKLQFVDYGYRQRFAASSRVAIFAGELNDASGNSYRIEIRVNERNLEGNGLKPPVWERTGTADMLVRALK